MIKTFVKKPIPISAVKWDGTNEEEIAAFCGATAVIEDGVLTIHTLEGDMRARKDDYIIKGVRGEFYPCERTIFEETYEEVNE